MKTTKEKIDDLPANELMQFRYKVNHLSRDQQLIEAGRFLSEHWFLHWTGVDSEYLLHKAGVKLKFRTK